MEEEKRRLIAEGGTARSRGKVVLATVKGDVHDIGKNIVGVVLACNNYEVVDLGVMVPCDRILTTAREQQADLIGLSGLITPSLDEMVHVAREMQRTGFELPLLIGGATTSAAHTAVKVAPEYAAPVVHVLDASRVIGVVSSLLSPTARAAFAAENRAKQDRQRTEFSQRRAARPLLALAAARARREVFDWAAVDIPRPEFLGRRVFSTAAGETPGALPLALDEIARYIDYRLRARAGGGTGAAQDPRQLDPAGLDRDRHDRAQLQQPKVRGSRDAAHPGAALGRDRRLRRHRGVPGQRCGGLHHRRAVRHRRGLYQVLTIQTSTACQSNKLGISSHARMAMLDQPLQRK